MGGNVQVSAYDPRIFMLIGVSLLTRARNSPRHPRCLPFTLVPCLFVVLLRQIFIQYIQ
jgi:hypothetical protein